MRGRPPGAISALPRVAPRAMLDTTRLPSSRLTSSMGPPGMTKTVGAQASTACAVVLQAAMPQKLMAGPSRSLVIGIGNPLRSDDGVGWRLAEEVGGLAVHQLTPELAAELAAVDRVLFVDAWQLPPGPLPAGLLPRGWFQPCLRAVTPGAGGLGSSHRLEPAELLALAAALYGARPMAHELLLPARDFAHGTRLSPPLRRQLPRARRLLREWLLRQGLVQADA